MSRASSVAGRAAASRVALVALAALVALSLVCRLPGADTPSVRAATTSANAVAPSCPAPAAGNDYSGATLVLCNFNGAKLAGAKFVNATLTAVAFDNADLTGADFTGATFNDGGNAMLPTDFSFATLTRASFKGAKFTGLTYLTYAEINCADFSGTDLVAGKARFGPSPLRFDRDSGCRPTFRSATMNCEFVPDWKALDLASAVVAACDDQLAKRDFSGGLFAGVAFDGADLSGTRWVGADLTRASFQSATLDGATGLAGTADTPSRLSGAVFNNASVQGVDLSNAQLYGADFTNANLTNSNLQGSFFTADVPNGFQTAAKFDGARLRDVNLSGAKLAGATFAGASFYGSFGGAAPTFPCQTDVAACGSSSTGATCACASARGADLTSTDFTSAFLYGVDFGDPTTTINGTKFVGAVLAGANFAGASFKVAQGGIPPDFTNAMLMGADLGSGSVLTNTSLSGAFVDFGASTNPTTGNLVQLLLPAKYTRFRGFWQARPSPICVQVVYGNASGASASGFTVVPTTIPSMTCPDGLQHPGGCGPTKASNPNWNNGLSLGGATPPGTYFLDSTYEPANQSTSCNAGTVDPRW